MTEQDATAAMARVSTVCGDDMSVFKDCDIVIEGMESFWKCTPFKASKHACSAVSEDFALKKKLFQGLDTALPENVIFASNTSSISITKVSLHKLLTSHSVPDNSLKCIF